MEEVTRIDPDFGALVVKCVEELKIKYSQYGNTWLEQDDLYYKERLMKEVSEYVDSMTVESERRKLLNIVNIAAMAFQTAAVNRGCRNHRPAFDDIMDSKGIQLSTVCLNCGKAIYLENGAVVSND